MMFKRTAALLFACTAASAVPLAPARANNFFVHGSLASMACLPSLVRTADADDGMLVLDRLAPDALPTVGSVVHAGRFSIALGDCGVSSEAVVSTWFYSSAAGAVSHGRLNPLSGNSTGWQYQFLSAGAGNIQLDVGISPTVAVSAMALGAQAANTTSLAYRVRYYRSGVTLIAGSSISYMAYVLYHH